MFNFPHVKHVSSLNQLACEASWVHKISKAIQRAQDQNRAHILLVFEHKEINTTKLLGRFCDLKFSLQDLGYRVQIDKISQGYALFMTWGIK